MSIYKQSWDISAKTLYNLNKDELLTPLLELIKRVKESDVSDIFYARTSHECLTIHKDSGYKPNCDFISVYSNKKGLGISHYSYSKSSKDYEVDQICKHASVDEAIAYLDKLNGVRGFDFSVIPPAE